MNFIYGYIGGFGFGILFSWIFDRVGLWWSNRKDRKEQTAWNHTHTISMTDGTCSHYPKEREGK